MVIRQRLLQLVLREQLWITTLIHIAEDKEVEVEEEEE